MAVGVWLAGKLGASDIAALRAMDGAALSAAAARAGYAPFGTVDGHILPRQLVESVRSRRAGEGAGSRRLQQREIRSLRFLAPPVPASAAAYTAQIRARYGDLAHDFLTLYPATNLAESVPRATRDAIYGWTAERLVAKQTALGVPAFFYYFDHGYPAADSAGLRAFHASELPYVFGTADRTPPAWPKIPAAPAEANLSDAMVGYWAAFARDGVPSAAAQPQWQPYAPSGPTWPSRRCRVRPRICCPACLSSTSRSCAAAASRAASPGTGTSASSRRRFPLECRNADDRRRHAVRLR